jgi:hypothetical protein
MPRCRRGILICMVADYLASPPHSCHFSRCRRRLSCRRACRPVASRLLPRHLCRPLLHLALARSSSSASMRTPSTLLTQNPLLMASGVRRVLPSERPTPVRGLIFEWSDCETVVLHSESEVDRWLLSLIYLGTCCSDYRNSSMSVEPVALTSALTDGRSTRLHVPTDT